jgi:hypothetical protein
VKDSAFAARQHATASVMESTRGVNDPFAAVDATIDQIPVAASDCEGAKSTPEQGSSAL